MKYSQAQAAGVTIDIGAILSDPRFQAAVKVIDGAGQTIAGITLLTAVVVGTGGFGVVGLVIFGAVGATSTVFGINDAVEGVLDARDIYQQGSVSGDNNFLRSHLPDGVYYAVDITSELVTSFGVGMAVGNKSAQKAATLEGGSTPKNVFPDNPDDLLPEIPRNKVTKANGTTSQTIQTSDNIRIRAEQHRLLPGETYNPRHHGVHYHVEYKVDPTKSWNNKNNVNKWYPKGYTPGAGSGFIPGEAFPE